MSEKIGEIVMKEIPYVSKGPKYIAEIRAFQPIEKLEYEEFDVLSYFNIATIEKWKQVPRLSGRFGKVLQEFDKKEGDVYYHYFFYIWSKDEHDPDDIASELKEHLEDNEGCKIQSITARRINKFPWEIPRVKKRIPITKEMLEKMIEKKVVKG